MNISLTPELDEYVREKVRSGLYTSAIEVICEGLRLLREEEQRRRILLGDLAQAISLGLDQLEAGQSTTYFSAAALVEDLKTKGRKRHATSTRQKRR